MECPRRTGECELGMIADEQRPMAVGRSGELWGNYRARARLQSGGQMFRVLDENNVVPRGRLDAGDSAEFNRAIANQAGSDCLSDLLQRALHGFQCIAAG